MDRDRTSLYSKEIRVRTMSYNVHYGIGMDNRYDLDRIAEAIGTSGAQLIGLQEVDVHWDSRSRYEDTIALLAEKLGMNRFFAPIYDLPPHREGEPRRQFGVAVLSRYPIVDAVNRSITRASTQTPDSLAALAPGFADVTLDVHGVPVQVYVTHLDFRADPAVRTVQVREMMEIMSRCPHEKLLMGDFNARPDAPELAPLFDELRDTWTEVGTEPGYTFPADVPDRKIDYILASSGFKTLSAEIIPTLASDHRPIVAELTLKI